MEHRVYWITKRIAQGQFLTRQRAAVARQQGVTHVLNVGESASIVSAAEYGFAEIRDCPIVDFERVSDTAAIGAIDALHEMLKPLDSRVYIHCVAGQNRSPTVLWLFLLACGMSRSDAKVLVSEHSPDSVPGHHQLVDDDLVDLVVSHGSQRFLPLADPLIVCPAFSPEP